MQSLNGDVLPKFKENRKGLVPNDLSTTLKWRKFGRKISANERAGPEDQDEGKPSTPG